MAYITQTPQDYYDRNDFGNYQFTSLDDVINQFMVAYVGHGKLISKIKRSDIQFHAMRALQELSFDTFKSVKAEEFLVPSTLQMPFPQDYVGYTKISEVDSAGIKHVLYPTSKTSNPFNNFLQDSDGDYIIQAVGTLTANSAEVVLDDEYKDILVGMHVSSVYIQTGTVVGGVSNDGGITTIRLNEGPGVSTPSYPTSDGTTAISNSGTTLTFSTLDRQLARPQKSSHIVENLSWNNSDYKITASSAADIADIKVGMTVFHGESAGGGSGKFPANTVVRNVFGTTIVVSNLPDAAVTSGGEILFVDQDFVDTTAWSNYKSNKPSENNINDYQDYQNDIYWPNEGKRYGLDPQHAQVNGSFYIDEVLGKIHFSSNISGKTVILDYISDSLGTDEEMQVHKFAEEAMYKCIAYAVLSTRINVPENIVRRYKKERFASIRNAKLRLSNLKLEELTQVLRGKSKQIKH